MCFSLGEDNPSLFPESGLESVPEMINFRIWMCRKLSLASAVLFLAYSVWAYKDYNILNNAILRDIQAQNQELRTALQLLKVKYQLGCKILALVSKIKQHSCNGK